MRYVKLPDIPDPAKPLICIYSAPASLCIAGYIQSVTPKSLSLLIVLWVIASILFVFACIKFVQYLKLPFFPSYAAYTFPFVISAIATKQLMVCAMNMEKPMPFLKPIVLVETIIATVTTLYALVRYLFFIFSTEGKR
jgi:exfoliative toxin A/B